MGKLYAAMRGHPLIKFIFVSLDALARNELNPSQGIRMETSVRLRLFYDSCTRTNITRHRIEGVEGGEDKQNDGNHD